MWLLQRTNQIQTPHHKKVREHIDRRTRIKNFIMLSTCMAHSAQRHKCRTSVRIAVILRCYLWMLFAKNNVAFREDRGPFPISTEHTSSALLPEFDRAECATALEKLPEEFRKKLDGLRVILAVTAASNERSVFLLVTEQNRPSTDSTRDKQSDAKNTRLGTNSGRYFMSHQRIPNNCLRNSCRLVDEAQSLFHSSLKDTKQNCWLCIVVKHTRTITAICFSETTGARRVIGF